MSNLMRKTKSSEGRAFAPTFFFWVEWAFFYFFVACSVGRARARARVRVRVSREMESGMRRGGTAVWANSPQEDHPSRVGPNLFQVCAHEHGHEHSHLCWCVSPPSLLPSLLVCLFTNGTENPAAPTNPR